MDNWAIILVAISSGVMLLVPNLRGLGSQLTAAGAVQRINREKAVVVDVRGADAFAAGHIGGARNIPLALLDAQLPGAVKNKALPLIVVCDKGTGARRAAAAAVKLGYTQAQALDGGMKAWKDANLPVVRA